MKQEFHVKQKFCLVNSYRNTISKWALGFRYRNFFIPRVEKNLKISPWEGNSNLPRAYGPWEDRVSSLGLIFGGFFNPWDEEISIPETRPIRKSYIPLTMMVKITSKCSMNLKLSGVHDREKSKQENVQH